MVGNIEVLMVCNKVEKEIQPITYIDMLTKNFIVDNQMHFELCNQNEHLVAPIEGIKEDKVENLDHDVVSVNIIIDVVLKSVLLVYKDFEQVDIDQHFIILIDIVVDSKTVFNVDYVQVVDIFDDKVGRKHEVVDVPHDFIKMVF